MVTDGERVWVSVPCVTVFVGEAEIVCEGVTVPADSDSDSVRSFESVGDVVSVVLFCSSLGDSDSEPVLSALDDSDAESVLEVVAVGEGVGGGVIVRVAVPVSVPDTDMESE